MALIFFDIISLILLIISLHQHVGSTEAMPSYVRHSCVNNGEHTQDSVYQNNLNSLLVKLSSAAQNSGFSYSQVGQDNTDQVYGLFLCRKDLTQDVCDECIKDASQRIVEECPWHAEAIVWYYQCMLRYSNRSEIFFQPEITPWSYFQMRIINASNYTKFEQRFEEVMSGLLIEASSDSSTRFSIKEVYLFTSSDQTFYFLAQCTPNINMLGCYDCLKSASQIMTSQYSGIIRAIFMPSCQLRYDDQRFFNPMAPTASTRKASTPKGRKLEALLSSVAGLVLLVITVIISFERLLRLLSRRREKRREKKASQDPQLASQDRQRASQDRQLASQGRPPIIMLYGHNFFITGLNPNCLATRFPGAPASHGSGPPPSIPPAIGPTQPEDTTRITNSTQNPTQPEDTSRTTNTTRTTNSTQNTSSGRSHLMEE